MGYTDKDLMVSTQIAYYDVKPKEGGDGRPIQEIIAEDRANHQGTYQRVADELEKAKKDFNLFNYMRYRDTKMIYDSIADGTGEYAKYGSWKIVSVNDDNNNSGFYGCVIDTGNKEAIVAYRGSESYNVSQFLKDWIQADFGLLNSTSTRQQREGRKYLKEIMNDPNLQYDTYSGTGHSLGGNLIMDAYLHLSKEHRDKMHAYNFDGPNFSNEYVRELKRLYKENGWDVNEATGRVTHYRWSPIGNIFGKNLPGVNYQDVKSIYDDIFSGGIISKFQKHVTTSLDFDEFGNLIRGDRDKVAKFIEGLTMGVDDVSRANILVPVILAVMQASDAEKKALGCLIVALLESTAFAVGIGPVLAGTLIILAALLITAVDLFFLGKDDMFWNEYLKDALGKMIAGSVEAGKKLVSKIKQMVKQALEKLKQIPQFINDMLNCVDAAFRSAMEWFYRQTVGFQYATANPYIVVDTTDMRARADRLRSISARAKRLDFRMNELYLQLDINWTSIIDLANLLKAGVLLDYAGRLDACANYLYQTAEDFDNVERSLLHAGL